MTRRYTQAYKIVKEHMAKPAPCDDCKNKYKCAEEEIACRAFALYVFSGSCAEDAPRVPDSKTYKRVFVEDDFTQIHINIEKA